MKHLQVILYLLLFFIYSCSRDPAIERNDLMKIPIGFPSMPAGVDNEFTLERWQLGKRLFYDPILSKSNKVSCATCHIAQNAFSDTIALSLGDNNAIGTTNSPTLTNIGYQPYLTRAGGSPTLEIQILIPIQEHNELNNNILEIAEQLNTDSTYIRASYLAYNRKPDPFVITRAIANFERSLISGNSKFDKFYFQEKKSVFTEQEKRGYNLFNSDQTNCSKCHGGFNFTDYTFKNNGLHLTYADSGRMRLTKLESDRALFKVPTLRNIALTKPYMHDGSLPTLEAVIEHYNLGGQPHKNKSELIQPLSLTHQEKQDLVAFLKTLTDEEFVNDKMFRKE